jgi:transcriptional regulator with XRE-family HTH domain
MPTDTAFAQSLRRERERAGLTVPELAQAAGLHRTSVWKLEAGLRPYPSWETVRALARALGVRPEAFSRGTKGKRE